MDRTWLHRGIAAGMGLVAALTLMGAKAVTKSAQGKQMAAQRKQAAEKMAALFAARGDKNSAEAETVLVQRQQEMQEHGLSAGHLDYFVLVLHQDIDALVICRSLGMMIALAKQGKLNVAQSERLKAEGRLLYGHKEPLVRGYALNLTSALKDKTAASEVGKLAKSDADAWVQSQAEKVFARLSE